MPSIPEAIAQNPAWPRGDDWPRVSGHRWLNDQSLHLTLSTDAHLSWFQGHFPGHPVLPGIVQLYWASSFARCAWSHLPATGAIDNLKFQRLVRPGAELELQLDFDGSKWLRFQYFEGQHHCSQGRLQFDLKGLP